MQDEEAAAEAAHREAERTVETLEQRVEAKRAAAEVIEGLGSTPRPT